MKYRKNNGGRNRKTKKKLVRSCNEPRNCMLYFINKTTRQPRRHSTSSGGQKSKTARFGPSFPCPNIDTHTHTHTHTACTCNQCSTHGRGETPLYRFLPTPRAKINNLLAIHNCIRHVKRFSYLPLFNRPMH